MKTMIITGAARGIGAATALLAARQGFAVVVNYNKQQQAAEKIVAQIKQLGGTALAIQADMAKEEDIIKLFTETDQKLGNLSALINNAGMLEKQMPVENMSVARLTRIFAVNTIGSFLCAKEAVKRMSLKNGGSGGAIVNVSSMGAITGSPNEYVDYAASKAAIDTLTIGLAKEVAAQGIRVKAVRPAFIHTDIHTDGGEPNRIERAKNMIPMKRGGTAQEVAEAICWLVSEKASYTTGSFINIAGGL